MDYLMGIDIGTSSLKTMIIDSHGGIYAVASKEYSIETKKSGYAEQNPQIWWDAFLYTIKKVLVDNNIDVNEIRGIGLSGQMHGLVLLDKNHSLLHNAILHCDVRSTKQVEYIKNHVDHSLLKNSLYNPIFPGMQLLSLLWIRDNLSDIYSKIQYVLSPKDYLRFLLTNRIGTERTDASATLAYDMKNEQWAFDILKALNINPNIFSDPSNLPYEVAGTITSEVANLTGLKKGTPVVYGGGDQAMQSIGNGVFRPGDMMATIGTSGQVMFVTDEPVFNQNLNTHTFAHISKNTWFGLGAILSAGITLNWFKSNFFPEKSYEYLSDLATNIEIGSNGLLFFPAMMGERTPYMDPNTKGIFQGITLQHTAGHFARSIMEGVSFEMKSAFDILVKLYQKPNYLIAAGGASKSPVWLQMQADIYDIPLKLISDKEQACIGSAIMAAIGVGLFSSIEDACSSMIIQTNKIILPIAENVSKYKNIYHNLYIKLYENNKDLFIENHNFL